MNLLGPIGLSTFGYIAAGAAVLVVSAYIIKMRRRRFEVPFAQLWKRVLNEKDANSLWKHLKRLLSLLFILLILGAVLFASLDPTQGGQDHDARSVVILIDASGSMRAMDGNAAGTQSRMDAAKAAADKLLDSMGGGDVAMVMKVDGQATPLSRFSSDVPMLHTVIHGGLRDAKTNLLDKNARTTDRVNQKLVTGIMASDTPADLPRALGAAADALRDRNNPLIVLISDGAFPEQQLGMVSWTPLAEATGKVSDKDLSTVDLSKIDVRYIGVGKRSDNVGIVAFNVRRYIANKAAYEVYIEMQNFGQEPAHRDLALYNGDTAVDIKRMDFAPGERKRKIYEKLPASDENKLRASLRPVADVAGGSDPFALDDTAYALLPLRKKQKVLMVTGDNLFLEAALLVYDNVDPLKVSPAEYDAKPALADGMDVVIFDEHTPAVIPPSPTSVIYFHPTGENSPFKIRGEMSDPHITEIDEGHPVMRWLSMSDVYTDKSDVFVVEPKLGESALARSVNDAVIVAKREGHRKLLAVGFSLPATGRESATDLPMRVAFPMMLVNALDWFAGDQSDLLTTYATGRRERVPLDGVVGATDAEVKGPDGALTKVPVLDGLATFYASHVGYYDLTAKGADGKVMAQIELATNLASVTESDIAPSASLALGMICDGPPATTKAIDTAVTLATGTGKSALPPNCHAKKLEGPPKFAISHSQKWWTYILLAAAALILLEWITYHRRITV